MPNSPRIPNDTWSNNNFLAIIMIGRVTVTQQHHTMPNCHVVLLFYLCTLFLPSDVMWIIILFTPNPFAQEPYSIWKY